MRRKDSVNLGSQNTRREVMERGCCDSQLSTNVCRRGWWVVAGGVQGWGGGRPAGVGV